MTIIVGCPVSYRSWILPAWFDHVEESCRVAGMRPTYAFVVNPEDLETVGVVEERASAAWILWVPDGRVNDLRQWTDSRYRQLTYLRNGLLDLVNDERPDLFLSLDSDILLHPDAVRNLIESTEQFDAVGGKVYMTPTGDTCPSWGMFGREGGLRREEASGVFPVEIIMAVKLMTPKAYAVRYSFHTHGEDLGWSKNCAAAGVKLGFDGRVTSKHVMSREALEVVDIRCGF